MDRKAFERIEPTSWWESFRWFESTGAFKVACAKSADQNILLLDRYADPHDLVFYADLPNSKFVLVKPFRGEVDDDTKKEAAEFAAANSDAWRKNLTHVDVYSVQRSQIKRSSDPMKSFGSASFIIYGDRAAYKNVDVRLSIGVKIVPGEKSPVLVCTPASAIKHNAHVFVTLKPGMRGVSDIASTIKNKIFMKAPDRLRIFVEKVKEDQISDLVPSSAVEIS
jgi:hypothetical protein